MAIRIWIPLNSVMMLRNLLAILILTGSSLAGFSATKPNVIIILSDDAGYADFGVTGGGVLVPTPHIDRLAEQGIFCPQGYVTASTCTPSRMGVDVRAISTAVRGRMQCADGSDSGVYHGRPGVGHWRTYLGCRDAGSRLPYDGHR